MPLTLIVINVISLKSRLPTEYGFKNGKECLKQTNTAKFHFADIQFAVKFNGKKLE